MAGKRSGDGSGFWPGVLAPLGLTLILAVCIWLFFAKVDAEQEIALNETLRLESYARLEAGEIGLAAKSEAHRFVSARMSARQTQIRNLGLEAKSVLDSVYNLLSLGLDQATRKSVSRRDVGQFPPGFEGMRRYLELAPSEDADPALTALRANSPEIAALMPAGCSLTVIEDYAKVLYSHGGGATREQALTVSASRDFMFNDGDKARRWSLRVEVAAPDDYPEPSATEVAAMLSQHFAGRHLVDAAWCGWLLDRSGEPAAVFSPADAGNRTLPPLVKAPGQWVALENNSQVWLESTGLADGLQWEPVVAVAVAVPPPAPDLLEAALTDTRWSLTISVLFLLTLAGWLWFMFAPKTGGESAAARQRQSTRHIHADTHKVERRLVRGAVAREIPEVESVIVADIGDDGSVRLDGEGARAAASGRGGAAGPLRTGAMPSGSLRRLQSIHRGRDGLTGSRILDHAKSPILKELAGKVRPVVRPTGSPVGTNPRRHPDAVAKTVQGWRKVEDGEG